MKNSRRQPNRGESEQLNKVASGKISLRLTSDLMWDTYYVSHDRVLCGPTPLTREETHLPRLRCTYMRSCMR